MKNGVIIVNTARGAVIDEEALAKALDSGKVAGVGLDVYEFEPDYIHPGLLNHPNALLIPHMGTYTVEVSETRSDTVVRTLHILTTTILLNRHIRQWKCGVSIT